MSDAGGVSPPGTSTGSTDAAPVRADVQGPISFMSGTNCDRGGNSITACVYYHADLERFTGPGQLNGAFSLASFDQYENHGEIYDNHGPVSPVAGSGDPVWSSYQSKGAGIEAYVKYHVQEDPFRTEDVVGYSIDMPYVGSNSSGCTATEFLFCSKQDPGEKAYSADYHFTFSNRPITVEVHNNVPGLVLTKQRPATMAGILADPTATNQADDRATLTADGGDGRGRAYYGGYRSNQTDATLTVEYEATEAAVSTDVGVTLEIQATVNKDDPTKASPATKCEVSSPTTTSTLKCRVVVAGSNSGPSTVLVEISK
ncbi:hypothetical protein GCM10009818_13250 [Nakamurella flavida]|uniref:hypothetical protein n=1 Tax=Nakamurella flavida TaxID=363630 RepID=UPI0031E13803